MLANRPTHSDAAVIDVGSNSVRLVFYRLEGRAIWTVFNEKVLAGLGRDLAVTGRLSPDGAAAAIDALSRFRVLIEAAKPDQVFTVATAAVRRELGASGGSGELPTREGVLRAIAGTAGLSTPVGPVTFDRQGDLREPVIGLYRIAHGKATFVRQGAVRP